MWFFGICLLRSMIVSSASGDRTSEKPIPEIGRVLIGPLMNPTPRQNLQPGSPATTTTLLYSLPSSFVVAATSRLEIGVNLSIISVTSVSPLH